jgi:hypothetical protein
MTRVEESGDGRAHAGSVGHDVVDAVAMPVVEPAGELRAAGRAGWIRRAEADVGNTAGRAEAAAAHHGIVVAGRVVLVAVHHGARDAYGAG